MLTGRDWYREQLVQANAHIDQGHTLIARQTRRIAELESDGHDARRARDLLQLMEDLQTLRVEHQHYLEHELEKFGPTTH